METRLTAVRTDCELECPRVDQGLRERGLRLVLLREGITEERLLAEVSGADLLLTCYTPITESVIAAAPHLRSIVKYGVGIDAIDITAARSRRVPVVNVPEYAEQTVAEAAFALTIALAKNLGALHMEMQTSGWAWPTPRWPGADLAGKTLGLVGFGRIGRSLARMAGAGFGMRIVAYDPFVSREAMDSAEAVKCERLSDLLGTADFVSLHAVLNADTRHLIGRAELAMMKRSAFLINVSRGALIDEEALVETVLSGRIAGVGLDVFSLKPLSTATH
jgi:D-3-phosphoglycerate dehydrogenase